MIEYLVENLPNKVDSIETKLNELIEETEYLNETIITFSNNGVDEVKLSKYKRLVDRFSPKLKELKEFMRLHQKLIKT